MQKVDPSGACRAEGRVYTGTAHTNLIKAPAHVLLCKWSGTTALRKVSCCNQVLHAGLLLSPDLSLRECLLKVTAIVWWG